VVLLTVIVALAVGWFVDHRRQQTARVAAEVRAKAIEAKEANWREANSWLTSALNEDSSTFGLPGQWKPIPTSSAGDSR
jgi:hypothetical protein